MPLVIDAHCYFAGMGEDILAEADLAEAWKAAPGMKMLPPFFVIRPARKV
jgi:hypothetical protein